MPLVLGVFALARAGRFEERDPYWQARAGMENLAGWPLIRPDTWSWSGVPGPWYQNSPLWNTLLGLGFGAGGFWGLYLVAAAVMLGYLGLVYVLALRLGGRRLPTLFAAMAAVAPALSMLSPRATLMAEVIMLASVLVVVQLSRLNWSRRPTAVLATVVGVIAAGLSVLGNLLHLSFLLISPALAGVWAVVWLLTPLIWSRRLVAVAVGGLGWMVGLFASPYGLELGWERIAVVTQVCTDLILEWTGPFAPHVSTVFWLMAAAAIVAAVLTIAELWRSWRAHTWSADDTGLLALALIGVPAAVAGLWAIRFLGIALLILAPTVAVVATRVLDRIRQPGPTATSRWQEYLTGGFWRIVMTVVALLLAPGASILIAAHAEPAEAAIIGQLPANCQLFSSGAVKGEIDGVVILIRPDVRVWVDGRADFYGRQHLIEAAGYLDRTMPTPVPPGTSCVVVNAEAPHAAKLSAAVASSRSWRLASSIGPYRMYLPAS